MVLTVDIGNTNVTFAVFRGSRITKKMCVPRDIFKNTGTLAKRIRSIVGARNKVSGVCIASVVPELNPVFRRVCRKIFGINPVFATWRTIPMRVRGYDRRQLGADRLVAAFAAWQKYRKPCIVIDAGTALTIDFVSARGEFAGGVIMPGLATAASSLHSMTAKLPLVKLSAKARILGPNTHAAINSGIVRGYAGLIDFFINEISRRARTKLIVILTGGEARIIAKNLHTPNVVHPDLIHKGLIYIGTGSRSVSC